MNNLLNTSVFDMLDLINDRLASIAANLKISSIILYIAVAVAAVLVGIAGMHLAKVLCMVGMGGIGYVAGISLFNFLVENVKFMANAKSWIAYIFGAVIALVFMFFGWRKCLYALFAIFGAVAYGFMIQCVSTQVWVALGGAILFAMLAMFFLKIVFVLLTSVIGSFVFVNCLGAMITKAKFLQIGESKIALWIVLGVAVLMCVIQFASTRNYNVVRD